MRSSLSEVQEKFRKHDVYYHTGRDSEKTFRGREELPFSLRLRKRTGGHLWFYRIRSKISSIIESTIFTSTLFLLYRIGSTVFVSTDVCSKQLMQPHDYCLQEYALQEHDLHQVGCKGMAIQPPSAAIKSEQRFWT